MGIFAVETGVPYAEGITVTEDTLSVGLGDGRTISVPLIWFLRLLCASMEERGNWSLVDRRRGIRWEDVDENISVEGLLAGRPSGEGWESFGKWLKRPPPGDLHGTRKCPVGRGKETEE